MSLGYVILFGLRFRNIGISENHTVGRNQYRIRIYFGFAQIITSGSSSRLYHPFVVTAQHLPQHKLAWLGYSWILASICMVILRGRNGDVPRRQGGCDCKWCDFFSSSAGGSQLQPRRSTIPQIKTEMPVKLCRSQQISKIQIIHFPLLVLSFREKIDKIKK